jgi:hypothetical protein
MIITVMPVRTAAELNFFSKSRAVITVRSKKFVVKIRKFKFIMSRPNFTSISNSSGQPSIAEYKRLLKFVNDQKTEIEVMKEQQTVMNEKQNVFETKFDRQYEYEKANLNKLAFDKFHFHEFLFQCNTDTGFQQQLKSASDKYSWIQQIR